MNFLDWVHHLLRKPRNPKPESPSIAVTPPLFVAEQVRPVRPILDVIKELSNEVHKSVLLEHLSVPNQEQLRGWIELGISTVRNYWRGQFNPAKDAKDAELQKELLAAEAAVIAARNNEGRARNNQRQSLLAAPGKRETRPSLPTPIIFAGVGGFAMLFTFTFIELPMLSAVDDATERILFAAIPGFVLASMVVFSAFHVRAKDDTAAVIFSKTGFREMTWQTASGLALIVGMGLVRLTLTSGWREQLFCIGLMVVEAALWGYLKTAACRNSDMQDEFDRRHEGDSVMERQAELCGQFHHEDEQLLNAALAAEAIVKNKLAERFEGDFDLEAMLRLAAAEIQTSYFNAIGHIKGQTVMGNISKDFGFRFRKETDVRSKAGNTN